MNINRYVSPIENEDQDRTSDSWKAMCKYVDELADSGAEEFSPREALGAEHFANIHTLPESIAKLILGLIDTRSVAVIDTDQGTRTHSRLAQRRPETFARISSGL